MSLSGPERHEATIDDATVRLLLGRLTELQTEAVAVRRIVRELVARRPLTAEQQRLGERLNAESGRSLF
jgi:hypothetical protein